MPASSLDAVPMWALSIALFAASLLLGELGFRAGRFRSSPSRKESEAAVGTAVAAELGLLAFLLAFTFGIVTSRFDVRRFMVLDEANAIGTTFLRAGMLPDAQREPVRALLRSYADDRIEAALGAPIDAVLRRSDRIHQQIWSEAVAAAEADPRSVPIGLFVQSLNALIDLHASRLRAIRSRLPLTVWLVLFSVALLAFFTMGYQAGLATPHRSPAAIVLAVIFCTVIWLVADLDRPAAGLFRPSQEPMRDVRTMMGGP